MSSPTIKITVNQPPVNVQLSNQTNLRVYCTRKNIALAISLLVALGAIAVGILAKLDKLGVQLPNGFSKDAALGISFAPLGILGAGGIAGYLWKKSRSARPAAFQPNQIGTV